MNISQYKGDFSTQKRIELAELMKLMQVEDKKRLVLNLRFSLKDCVPGSRCAALDKVPFIVFGATYKKVNNKQQMLTYNGLILLEINNLADTDEAAKLRDRASMLLQTVAAFVGSGGKSLKIIVSFVLPDGSLPRTAEQAELFHAHAYRRAASYYQTELKREITLKRPSVQNGCRFSFDPDLYFNSAALPVHQEQPLRMPEEFTWEEAQLMEPDAYKRLFPGMKRSTIVSLLYETSLKEAMEWTGGIDEEDPKPFLVRLAENCFRSGIPEDDVIKWTWIHTDMKPYEIMLRATVHNTYSMMSNFGSKPCIPAVQTMIIRTEEFMQRRMELRRNELKGVVEFRERGSFYFDFFPVTDMSLNGMCINAQKEGIDLWDKDIRRYVYSDKIRLFNPIDYYLSHLPQWDGTDRISDLADTLPLENRAVWRKQFRRWFLGMVANWQQMNQTHANSVLPLLVGNQGCGKSTWCRNLLPPVLQEYFTDSIDFSNKRYAEQYLSRFALINIDEFDSVNVSQQAFLKHLLQKPVVNSRQAYKSNIIAKRRFATFIATCNNMDLLTDRTGSRRFICVEIKGMIDTSYKTDYDQLYAQALAALRDGERYWFNSEEEAEITQNNKPFQKVKMEEELFLQYFRPARNDEPALQLTAAEIIQYIKNQSKINLGKESMSEFIRILKSFNVRKKHLEFKNVYLLILKEH